MDLFINVILTEVMVVFNLDRMMESERIKEIGYIGISLCNLNNFKYFFKFKNLY